MNIEPWDHESETEAEFSEYRRIDKLEILQRIKEKAPEMYDLIMKLSRCVVYGEGGTIEVRDWNGLEAVLRAGNAIYQEVEGL